jgi:Ca2+-binding RTX toxin-like protein
MRDRRRRAMRAVLGVLGGLVVAPAAHAATCIHAGGMNGTATLTFGAGDGTVTLSQDLDGGDGADTPDGGAGEDTADFSTVSHGIDLHGVDADLARGSAISLDEGGASAVDILKGFEDLLGSGYADKLTGDGHANTLDGGSRDE